MDIIARHAYPFRLAAAVNRYPSSLLDLNPLAAIHKVVTTVLATKIFWMNFPDI